MTQGIPLARLENYTTFQLGGPCKLLVECPTPESLMACVQEFHRQSMPFILIGGGSNLVVSDEGLPCAVIRYASATPLIERDGCDLTVSGSTELDALALYCVNEGLSGLNFATGIPGTVGGAVIGNAGAWGQQVGDVLTYVTLLTRSGKLHVINRTECGFQYRHSKLKETGEIAMNIHFHLQDADPLELAQERMEILKKRADKHPNLKTHPCAGSFFRNV
ncbi:MAG: FAD-binding protein, partial [Candidatus Omnitrophica bacterium]|nr:FAD-binding protein [Candidatus Omnitrophota bacterium]